MGSYGKIQRGIDFISEHKEKVIMAAIATSLIGYTVKAVIFAALAYAGIICGKKFRDKKEADRA